MNIREKEIKSMTFIKPTLPNKTVKKYEKVLFGSGSSRPYSPYTLLSDVTVTTKDTRSTGTVRFNISGTLPDGRVIQAEGFLYKKGRSPWKFSSRGLAPLQYSGGMLNHCEDAIHFMFEPGEWDRSYSYKFPESLLGKEGWSAKQTWQEW
ncbi:MAG: hypothetical protein ACO3YX_07170 [Candidatus Nanopelagicaceae bacterium]